MLTLFADYYETAFKYFEFFLEQEPKQFNDFLHHLVKFCQEKDLKSLGEYLASPEITLISKKEAPDSEVYKDDARSFIKGAKS
ncbi:ATP-dependent DNA helicase 2 subunit KU80 [Olea europaea subsp. europaea]|uniref:ATP-dependent DNA helicase 2 subunit KU80 n=1 Tax=Olea europaea subsp. europaea TaxID=158383 RepID=A0A8S0T8T4_OLEEU|nr:ATP-dependent DNA helicase 2 subunit KU80 [Olea europaea subsp. europaea]